MMTLSDGQSTFNLAPGMYQFKIVEKRHDISVLEAATVVAFERRREFWLS